MESNVIVIENQHFSLKINENCVAESLIYKANGEECLKKGEEMPLFSLTENRPFSNEIKLAHPNKRMTFNANRVRREGNKLIVGFELIAFEAVVAIDERPDYVLFKLEDFIILPEHFSYLDMIPQPVAEFRFLQLPVCDRARFGEWLNVMWDDNLAVNVIATSPYARIDAEKRKGYHIMSADAVKGIKLKGCEAALIVCASDEYMDIVKKFEEDLDLPKGVASRRSEHINRSIYWTDEINPSNVDENIAYAKAGGFDKMLMWYRAIFKEGDIFSAIGDYDYKDEYPEGDESLRKMLEKIKAAGITPGFHFLHTHIGMRSRYVTPVADHRLNVTAKFTLAKPLGMDDTTIYVEENPEDSTMEEKCRVLKFGGELIYYEGYSTEYPYCFTGCTRGYNDTNVTTHLIGTVGGILDISEYLLSSVYLNQYSSLQDEVADKIARIYNTGFEFVYMDGSEGTNPPYEFHVPNAQYRVYKKFDKKPLFCEGAAKSHFSWHMMSGGNAFDVFPTNIFKKCIAKYPVEEAPRMANDFTRVNFGWWEYYQDTQPDVYEYGTSRAAAWNCPATMEARTKIFKTNPRTADNLEVMRRWEDVRRKNWLTEEQKEMLKNPDQEHILIINENGEYELLPYDQIEACDNDENIKAFVFERKEKSYVVFWHTTGSAKLSLPLDADDVTVEEEIGGKEVLVSKEEKSIVVPIDGRKYISSSMPKEKLIEAFIKGKLI